jgi:hypothetical protein
VLIPEATLKALLLPSVIKIYQRKKERTKEVGNYKKKVGP